MAKFKDNGRKEWEIYGAMALAMTLAVTETVDRYLL